MIYSDGTHVIHYQGKEKLHESMAVIGIKRCWFHSGSRYPHYDLPKSFRDDDAFLEKHGIKKVTPREIWELLLESGQIKKLSQT